MIKSMIFDYQSEEDGYKAKDIRAVYKNFMSNGVLLEKEDDISTNTKCKVVPITGGVKISSGVASINGSQAIIEDEEILIDTNGTYKIVLEWNLVLNKFIAKYIDSTQALTRKPTVHQIQLAKVVKSGATYTVTDTRADTNVCGYANRMLDSQAEYLQQQIDKIANSIGEEHGISGIWEYTKKANGEYSCWTSLLVDAEINLPWDSGYISSEPSVDYPITFVDYPDPQYSYISDTSSSALMGQGTSTHATKSRSGGFILFRPSKGHANGAIKLAVHGHWK